MTFDARHGRAVNAGSAPVWRGWLLLAVLCFGVCLTLAAQTPPDRGEPVDENHVKAVFIYNFFKFVTWPDGQEAEAYTVVVIGHSVITALLVDIAEKKHAVLDKPILVRQLTSADEIGRCHILFIPKSQNDNLEEIMTKTEHKHILTVGEGEGLAAKGVGINMIREGEKVKIEINKGVTDREGLRVSPQLLNVARVVVPTLVMDH